MYHWDRDISGRLQRVSTPIEQGCEWGDAANLWKYDPRAQYLPSEQKAHAPAGG